MGGKAMKKNYLVVIVLIAVSFLTGCISSRSMNVAYKADSELLSNAAAFDKITLGIAKFEDKRALVKKEDPQSESYVGANGPIKIGVTYKETEYTPVKDMVQDILVQEFARAGFKTRAIDKALSNSNAQSIKDLNPDQAIDYVLGGQILTCEFETAEGSALDKGHLFGNIAQQTVRGWRYNQ
jgi:hypothetical protein